MYRLAPHSVRRRLRRVPFVALFMLVLAATGCMSPPDPIDYSFTRVPSTPTVAAGEPVPFSVLVTGSRAGSPKDGWPEDKRGGNVLLATNPQEYAALWAQIPEPYVPPPAASGTSAVSPPAMPPAVDFRSHAVIAIFYDRLNCERTIGVTQVLQQRGSLLVYTEAELILPPRACPAETHMLFQLVTIPWDGTPADQVGVDLVLYPVYPKR